MARRGPITVLFLCWKSLTMQTASPRRAKPDMPILVGNLTTCLSLMMNSLSKSFFSSSVYSLLPVIDMQYRLFLAGLNMKISA